MTKACAYVFCCAHFNFVPFWGVLKTNHAEAYLVLVCCTIPLLVIWRTPHSLTYWVTIVMSTWCCFSTQTRALSCHQESCFRYWLTLNEPTFMLESEADLFCWYRPYNTKLFWSALLDGGLEFQPFQVHNTSWLLDKCITCKAVNFGSSLWI